MGVTVTTTSKAGQYFAPVGGTIPAGILTTDEYNAAAQTYLHPATYYAKSQEASFNTQGQRWLSLGADADGVVNVATPRTGVPSITETEILFTGLALDFDFIGTSYYDSQVYVEVGGRMYKAKSLPWTGTVPGVMHRRLVFTNPVGNVRIRFVLGGGTFVGVTTEQSAIIRPAPSRQYGILDGDKFADSGTKQVSGASYLTARLADFMFERTGIAWGRRAEADTGFFHNGNAVVSDDTAALNGSTRWFSQARKDHLGPDFAELPLFYVLLGSLADAASTASMSERALECYEWVRDQDPNTTLVHVSALPLTGAGGAGTPTGPPSAGNAHDLNRQAQQGAIGGIARARYVNAYGPTSPWWTGAGSNGAPASSQQAALIGPDASSMNHLGDNYLATRIVAEIGQHPVYTLRARGQE